MMLGTIPDKRIQLLKELSKDYKIILLSNTNSIHMKKSLKILEKETGYYLRKYFTNFTYLMN